MHETTACCQLNTLVRRHRYSQLPVSPSGANGTAWHTSVHQQSHSQRPGIKLATRPSYRSSRTSRTSCMSQTGYAQPSMSIGVSPTQPQTQPHHNRTGVFWTAVVLVCTAIVALAGAFTAFIVYMRPVLKGMESAAKATETASQAMERSAKEFEQANLMLLSDTPAMIAEMEAAAREYSELGHTLNMMTAGFRGKNPVKDWSQLSIKKVAKDVSTLTSALTPAMEQWRKRIGQIAINFETSHRVDGKSGKQLKPTQAVAEQKLSGAENVAVKGSQSLQEDAAAAAAQSDAQQAAAAVQAVDSLQQSFSQIAGSETSAKTLPNGSSPEHQEIGASNTRQQQPESSAPNIGQQQQQQQPDSSASSNKQQQQQSNGARRQSRLVPQDALNLVDTASTQKGADVINEAAVAAERVASEADRLAADIVNSSLDGEAVEEAYKQSANQKTRKMSPEERRLLRELQSKKQAAEAIFRALERAESAATAAATASGALENAMQAAQAQQGLAESPTDMSADKQQKKPSPVSASRQGPSQQGKSC